MRLSRTRLCKTLSASAGFTIIEVMVSVGIASVLALGMAGMLNGVMSGQKRIEMKNTAISKNGIITSALADPILCSSLMVIGGAPATITVPAPYATSVPAAPITLDQLQLARPGAPAVPILQTGAATAGLIAKSIVLTVNSPVGQVGTTSSYQYEGTLTVTYDFTDASLIKMQPQNYDMFLTVQQPGGVITACNGGGVAVTEQSACENDFGGTYSAASAPPRCTLLGGTTTINNGGATVVSGGSHVTGNSTFANDVSVGGNLSAGGTLTAPTGTITTLTSTTSSTTTSSTGTATIGTANVTTAAIGTLTGKLHSAGGDADGFGNIFANAFITPSDRRLKENLQPLAPQTLLLDQISTYTYNYKSDKEKTSRAGVIAQELQKLYPHMVLADKNGMMSVNYMDMVPILIKSLQESNQRLDSLEEKMKRLEKQIEKSPEKSKPKNS